MTRSSGATSRSRFCRRSWRRIPIGWRGSAARRAPWPRSITRTSASIYGLEEADGVRGLVLELVDGETLADRIARGPLAIERGAAGRRPDGGSARGRARQRHRPPRSEARQRQDHHRPASSRCSTSGSRRPTRKSPSATTLATRAGTVMGTAGLHESGAGARRDGRSADRHLGVRVRALRDADGAARVRRPHGLRLHRGRAHGEPDGRRCRPRHLLRSGRCWRGASRRIGRGGSTRSPMRGSISKRLSKGDARGVDLHAAPAGRQTNSWPAWLKWSLAAGTRPGYRRRGLCVPAGRGAVSRRHRPYNVDLDLPEGTAPWAGLAISPDGKAVAASITPNSRWSTISDDRSILRPTRTDGRASMVGMSASIRSGHPTANTSRSSQTASFCGLIPSRAPRRRLCSGARQGRRLARGWDDRVRRREGSPHARRRTRGQPAACVRAARSRAGIASVSRHGGTRAVALPGGVRRCDSVGTSSHQSRCATAPHDGHEDAEERRL